MKITQQLLLLQTLLFQMLYPCYSPDFLPHFASGYTKRNIYKFVYFSV